jgi:hypothetical protein
MDPLSNLNPPAIIGEQVAGRSFFIRKQLQALVEDIKTRTFDLAELLYTAKHENLYPSWGFNSIGEYGATELGLKERKTQYLVRIVEVCKAVGVKRADYEPVGVSKLREITSLDPTGYFHNPATKENEPLEDHIVDLLTEADEMSITEVAEKVRTLKGMTEEDAPVIRSTAYTKSVYEKVIKPAQELARKRLGSAGRDDAGNAIEYSDGAVEEMIHAEFLADPNNYPEEPTTEVPMEEPQI